MIETTLFFQHDGSPQSEKRFAGETIFPVHLDWDFELRVGDKVSPYFYFLDMWDTGNLLQGLDLLDDEKNEMYVYLNDYLYEHDFFVHSVLYSINGKKEIIREVNLMPE